ncbi:MAG: diguanylate cyclase [Desulfotignum sp.]|nr:diguanylate cyclase [Desulfotignum sp.]
MTATTHHALILASKDTVQIVHDALDDLSELFFIQAETTQDAMAHIGARSLAFIIMDMSLPGLDPQTIAAALTGLPHTRIPPLMLVTKDSRRPDLYDQAPPLLIDHMAKPLDPTVIRARLLFFSAFFRQRIAMEQSIQELEKVYERFMEQHQAVLAQTVARKELQTSLSTFINQSRPFLSRIQAGTFFLNQAPDLPKRLRQGVSRIRNTGKQMAKTIQNLQHFQNRETDWPALFKDRNGHPRSGRILFATPFSDEFQIVRHHLTHRIRATLFQAESTDEAMMSVADTRPDLILINHRLNDGSGLHLLEKLVRLGTRAPVIFVVSRNHTDAGAAAVASGAQTFLIIEHTTGMDLTDTIQHSLAQAKMIHQVQGAMNRIELISRRDQLTLLLNRSGFNQTLAVEMAKARRYHLPLSISLAGIDHFKSFQNTYGHKAGDDILTACAARIKALIRDEDVVCRFAADKFAVVLPNTDANRARILAERIRLNMFEHRLQIGTRMLHLTVSIGTASFDETRTPEDTSPTLPELVQQAIHALERSIQRGGNQIQS